MAVETLGLPVVTPDRTTAKDYIKLLAVVPAFVAVTNLASYVRADIDIEITNKNNIPLEHTVKDARDFVSSQSIVGKTLFYGARHRVQEYISNNS